MYAQGMQYKYAIANMISKNEIHSQQRFASKSQIDKNYIHAQADGASKN